MNKIFEETYFLSASESNAEQELSLPLLMSKIIDIATAHANSLGIGNPSMTDIKAGWVLSRVTIEMQSYPKVNTSYTISTWIEDFNRHFSARGFKISSPDGEITYGYVRSIWMVMSTEDHSNVGLSHFKLPTEMIDGTVPPIEKQQRHTAIVTPEEAFVGKNEIIATHPAFAYRFKYCDLDYYRHVNTVRYVTLILNRFTLEEHDKTFFRRLELSFMHEANYGLETELLRADSDSETELKTSFLLRKASDASPLFFARVVRENR